MYERYPLFHSHLDLAHQYWKTLVTPGDTVMDATCGNGHDTLVLAQCALTPDSGKLYAMDLQQEAIDLSKQLLLEKLDHELYKKIHFVQGCHSEFPKEVLPGSVKLITYNLGYLPGGDKSKTTLADTTLRSIQRAQELLMKGGMLSITCYPGHSEGKREEGLLLDFSASLDPRQWSCCHHRWTNRSKAPSLLIIQRQMPKERELNQGSGVNQRTNDD